MALAEAIKSAGGSTCFVSRSVPPHLRDLARQSGHDCARLDGISDVADDGNTGPWSPRVQAEDAAATRKALADEHWDWLVFDHYRLSEPAESALRPTAGAILAIDDFADRVHDCDVLLDQNLWPDMDNRYRMRVSLACRQLLGPEYALLRSEIRSRRAAASPRSGLVRRIMVSLGGADPDNVTSRVIDALRGLGPGHVQVDVVIGASHSSADAIRAQCRDAGFQLHVQTARMPDLMLAADLAIGAGGSSTWEFCCLGLPSLAVPVVEHQVAAVRHLIGLGILLAGASDVAVGAVDTKTILGTLAAPGRLAACAQRSFELVDGNGVQRVAEHLGGTRGL